METRLAKSPVIDTEKPLVNIDDSGIKDSHDSSDTSSATEPENNADLSDKDDTIDKESKPERDNENAEQITEYTVGARDTLNSIAAKHNTTPSL